MEPVAHLIYGDKYVPIEFLKAKPNEVAEYVFLETIINRKELNRIINRDLRESIVMGVASFKVENKECIFLSCRTYFCDQHYGDKTVHLLATSPTVHYKDTCLKCSVDSNDEEIMYKGNFEGKMILRKLFPEED